MRDDAPVALALATLHATRPFADCWVRKAIHDAIPALEKALLALNQPLDGHECALRDALDGLKASRRVPETQLRPFLEDAISSLAFFLGVQAP